MKRITLIGTLGSLLWLGFFAWLIYLKRTSIESLTLNEWGDLFGGFMAPLALVWLVLGYIQQGEELRLNTEALKAQQEELQNQVRETAALVQASARQAEASERMARTAQSQYSQQQMERITRRLHRTAKADE